MSERSAPDYSARQRIVQDLDSTLFVEAGAGSGKTTALVNRVVALVTTGTAEMASIAAITFTEKAGAQLRDRVRSRLSARTDAGPASPEGVRCRRALDQLDGAAVGTLHSFAQRVLSEHPVEAGLPPRIEVLDEVSSGVEFERRWSTFHDQLLADPALERTLLLLFASGVQAEALRSLAVAFDQNWDLVAERVGETAADPPPVRPLVEAVLARLDSVVAIRRDCPIASDGLVVRLEEMARFVARLRGIDDEFDLLDAMAGDQVPSFAVNRTGSKANWPPFAIDAARRQLIEAGEQLGRVRAQVSDACAQRVGAAIRPFTLGAARERQAAGRLAFHDLLVLARALLRHPVHGPQVRVRLHARYDRLLLDEFQDTDPIQIDLAVRIAAADPAATATGSAEWVDVPVAAGHLFVVGDPKQSIYRFRRADIATFLAAAARFGADGGGAVSLTANFRSVAPVIEWVNHTFGVLMAEASTVGGPASQPPYVSLDPIRPGPPSGPPVAVLGRRPHPYDTRADDLRAAEAAEVADAVVRAVAEGWAVGDGDDPDGGWRPARLGDITILVPSRTSLPFLEEHLERAGVAFRAESSSLVYASRAVRDLLMVLRAVDDPTDHLRVVAALRTPLLGCGDDDLFRFKVERGGSWSYLSGPPATVPADDPVRRGLAYLRSVHDQRFWLEPSELLDRIARDRRALELGFADRRPRDVWRRLRFVIDQARAWSEATGGTLRHYLRWVDQQTAEGARVAEAVLPETDDDAVRIMTIHSAKGLQFPITIVSGASTVPGGRSSPAEVVFPAGGGVGYRFGGGVRTADYSAWAPIDEQMGFDERIRLLYVACTRTGDHLVVSLHRKNRARDPELTHRTNAELLVEAMSDRLDELPDAAAGTRVLDILPAERAAPPQPLSVWAAELHGALSRAGRRTAVAATALTATVLEEGGTDAIEEGGVDAVEEPDPGLQKRPRDIDLPPWLKGRYGTAVGRAVHGVLQSIDLLSGAGLDAAVAVQCEAEAVPDRADDVCRLVGLALTSPSVIEAASRPHWREVYACTPVDGGRLLEGYVDLLYRSDDGLVVVDYKTARSSAVDLIDSRVDGYRRQGASYALVVGAATAEPVIRVTFVFLTPDGAVERDLTDLATAVADVRALVVSGRELTTD